MRTAEIKLGYQGDFKYFVSEHKFLFKEEQYNEMMKMDSYVLEKFVVVIKGRYGHKQYVDLSTILDAFGTAEDAANVADTDEFIVGDDYTLYYTIDLNDETFRREYANSLFFYNKKLTEQFLKLSDKQLEDFAREYKHFFDDEKFLREELCYYFELED